MRPRPRAEMAPLLPIEARKTGHFPGRTLGEAKGNTMPPSQLPTIDAQRRFWDWHWQHAEERRVVNGWTLRRGETILRLLESLRLDRPRILDLGCGHGWFSAELARLGEVTGIDLSDEAVARARAQYPGITFIAGDLYDLPLPLGDVDVVVSQEVVAHVHDPEGYVRRAAQALRPGGYLVLATANRFVMERLGDLGWSRQPPEHIAQHLDRRGLRQLLRPYFRVLRLTSIIPLGERGILRVINSHKLNIVLGWLIPRRYLEALKEWAGLGYELIVLAQRRG